MCQAKNFFTLTGKFSKHGCDKGFAEAAFGIPVLLSVSGGQDFEDLQKKVFDAVDAFGMDPRDIEESRLHELIDLAQGVSFFERDDIQQWVFPDGSLVFLDLNEGEDGGLRWAQDHRHKNDILDGLEGGDDEK